MMREQVPWILIGSSINPAQLQFSILSSPRFSDHRSNPCFPKVRRSSVSVPCCGVHRYLSLIHIYKTGEETSYVSAFMGIEAWRKNEALDSFDVLKKGEPVSYTHLQV